MADPRGRDLRPFCGGDFRRPAEPFCHGEDCGQLDLHLAAPVVLFAAQSGALSAVDDLELADCARERQVEQLGELGPHLPGLGVE
jgi:hypothetical protein